MNLSKIIFSTHRNLLEMELKLSQYVTVKTRRTLICSLRKTSTNPVQTDYPTPFVPRISLPFERCKKFIIVERIFFRVFSFHLLFKIFFSSIFIKKSEKLSFKMFYQFEIHSIFRCSKKVSSQSVESQLIYRDLSIYCSSIHLYFIHFAFNMTIIQYYLLKL